MTANQKPLTQKSTDQKIKIGVLGGMGVFATIKFQEIFFEVFKNHFILQNNRAPIDQDFPEIIVDFACKVPDRNSFILDKSHPSPIVSMQDHLKQLEKIGCNVIVAPCNTLHYFLDDLESVLKPETKIINIIEYAGIKCKKDGHKKPLLLATSATIKSGLYQKYFPKNLPIIIPTDEDISETMEIIYGEFGVKKGFVDEANQDKLQNIVANYDTDCLILGCTELPLISEKVSVAKIDPMREVCEYLVVSC